MSRAIFLDTTPLGLVSQRPGKADADACRRWVEDCLLAGHRVLVPEIADYEIRRELMRAGKTAGLVRLDSFNAARPDRYLPLTTAIMRLAAALWARARNAGVATADIHSLDGDVILAAQVLALNLPTDQVIVATANVGHLTRFVHADLWSNIQP